MAYYTTIKTVNKDGKPVKADISCGGKNRGFTNSNTGELSFEMYSNDFYDVYAKSSISGSAKGKVKGGGEIVLRLK